MTIFNVLSLIGGLCLFLFGMNIMGQALERRAGSGLSSLLSRLTTKKSAGILTGIATTAVIQSSSATTVMVVGFVNSGLMTLNQSLNVIMGANIGTTITSWILSLAGIDSSNVFVNLLKPSAFTPVFALVGIVFYLFFKSPEKKDTGTILLGFATLMFGMQTMSSSVSGLGNVPQFQNLFIMFKNPILGVLVGAALTAVIQSSSASVGILQALAITGQVSYSAAIPIIMGQNIGTCVTAIISSIGANKNAKRAGMAHLLFNVVGTSVLLSVFCIYKAFVNPKFLNNSASLFGIAVAHTIFNVLCTLLIVPFSSYFEKLVKILVPNSDIPDTKQELDERLLASPPIALQRCREVTDNMAKSAVSALKNSILALQNCSPVLASSILESEQKADYYEDVLSTYLVKLSSLQISESDSQESAKLLKTIGDFERISDHAVNILNSVEEMQNKAIEFTPEALSELKTISSAVEEILDLSLNAFVNDDLKSAYLVEPLEQVVDRLKEQLRSRHIKRLQSGDCSIDAGFVLSDILTNLARTSDHCSNIAGSVIDVSHNNMNIHESLRQLKTDNDDYKQSLQFFANKYSIH